MRHGTADARAILPAVVRPVKPRRHAIGDEQLRKQLLARLVTYLLGGLDTLPLAGFDASCPAMAQGPHRLGRGQAFAAYVKQRYATEQKVVVVTLCGHSARCMFTADPTLPVLFPKP